MEKETVRNRELTEQKLLAAVDELVREQGFEGLGVNAVAGKAGVSKMLIYRYFNSLNGLIAAYIQQHDYWINFNEELPDKEHLGQFIKKMFQRQITLLRNNYTLRRLYRWELTTDNDFVKQLRNTRETKGIEIVEAVSRISGHSKGEVAIIATLINTSVSYLALLEENCTTYNGLEIQKESGWQQIEKGIDSLVDFWTSDFYQAFLKAQPIPDDTPPAQ